MTQEANETTRAVRAALETDTQHGAVVPPIHLTSTFAFVRYGQKRGYDYSRSGNPTRDALAGAVADLEGGAGAVITSSGMAAVTLVAQLFRPDDLAVVPHDCYGGTYRLFNALHERGALRVRFIEFGDAAALARAARGTPRAGVDRDADRTRCCASSTSRGWRARGAAPARSSSLTIPSCRRYGRSRCGSVRTRSYIQRPSTSTATATSWAGRLSPPRPSCTSASHGGATASARRARPSTPI